MTGVLRRTVERHTFDPGVIGLLINPFWIARRALRKGIASMSGELHGRLLDVGCGGKPYLGLFDVDEYVGLEIDRPQARSAGVADVFYDGDVFPFPDRSFDSLMSSQVLEHVFEPDRFLSEIGRVLKPGGRFLLTVPFIWDEHEQPWDFARYTSFGLQDLIRRNGLELLRIEKLCADSSVLFQLMNAYLYKVTTGRSPMIRRLLTVIVMAPVSALGFLAGKVLPPNPDLYLDQVVLGVRR